LAIPEKSIASTPPEANPAPTIEKMRAWLELEGTATHQVNRFQAMAEISAAITSCCVATSGGTMPRPTVLATAVPDSAPMMFRMAAMLTAWPGVRTRVATDVAMALAVS
jgi:hypothetical protein